MYIIKITHQMLPTTDHLVIQPMWKGERINLTPYMAVHGYRAKTITKGGYVKTIRYLTVPNKFVEAHLDFIPKLHDTACLIPTIQLPLNTIFPGKAKK